ncbi:MAG TPA: bifunctional oligoribonuclease/PAP phosphatase NrnA [Bacteroidetes bacterium]|nr:bifunctional oligoribonuclease/PAP phosphatase NrnA [Bacteroidota bacterium]
MQQEFEALRKIIDEKRRFVLTTHVNPDADGIGSELALAAFLNARGKETSILNHHATPWHCRFLDPPRRVAEFDERRDSPLLLDAEVIFVLDANHPDRLGSLKPFVLQSRAFKICIDHHLEGDDFAGLNLIDEASAATGEILYRLLTFIDEKAITEEIATCLYTAIMTDTGSFRFPKTNPELHRIVADLIERGADPVRTYQQVYERSTSGRLRLLGRALAGLTMAHHDKLAYFVVTREMFRETGTNEADTDNFISSALTIEGVQIGLMFTEMPDCVKISFRSKGDIPINLLARDFGGNGHKNAAGARVHNDKLVEIIARVLERSQHYIP